ncbi:hypothetical protein M407DRAFT_35106 [Tulasnella calospora MUT 4182]|uniref:Uncharacterized protein n=1 Tax=Tulasnella calospora MUT 4182 TaxID=1051891 RepID=A0A0C3K1S1_9AGAM|nr:hypothetical protein M407DRAFT_35106 [Tulasnella calospora MUT 4182]
MGEGSLFTLDFTRPIRLLVRPPFLSVHLQYGPHTPAPPSRAPWDLSGDPPLT